MKGFVTGIPGNQGKGADRMRYAFIRQGAPGQKNFPDIHLQEKSGCSPMERNDGSVKSTHLQDSKGISIFGGGDLIAPPVRAIIADEYIINIAPVLCGSGIP